jgi:adenine-specific DNA-methyltransferase
VKAFRDTWELGIHSYLTYLRERLVVARELLNESGSCFVQISDENVHLVRNLLDEIFGNENFVNEIIFKKASSSTTKYIGTVCDYILWYAKDMGCLKYRQLYLLKIGEDASGFGTYKNIELKDGTRRPISKEEIKTREFPLGSRLYRLDPLISQSGGENARFPIEVEGKVFYLKKDFWKTNLAGMQKLIQKHRVVAMDNVVRYIRYIDDFSAYELNNLWVDVLGAMDKMYVVQTNEKVIQRCILMSTDPGDIILDPTCGSGTSAYVAEQWGRRWITTDTSRVALALARTRLISAKYPYYLLKDTHRVNAGFEYETVPHVTLKSLANDEEAEQEVLYDKPLENKKVVRVAGPFSVESLSPHRVSDAQEMVNTEKFVQIIIDNLLKAGIQTGEKGARVEFANLDILPAGPEVQAVGEYKTVNGLKKAAVSIGPEFGSVDDDFIRSAITVAKRFSDLLVVAATSFDGSAHYAPTQVDNLRVMKVKINPDLSMGDLLKKTGSGNLFLAFGEPEIKVNETKEGIVVEILGVDVYDPVKSEIRSSGSGDPEHDIAAWFIDTNYSGEAFFVSHAYFLGEDKPYEKLKKALKADINEELWDELYSTKSRPFPKPKSGKIAVKVINHFGDEVMKVVEVS